MPKNYGMTLVFFFGKQRIHKKTCLNFPNRTILILRKFTISESNKHTLERYLDRSKVFSFTIWRFQRGFTASVFGGEHRTGD